MKVAAHQFVAWANANPDAFVLRVAMIAALAMCVIVQLS